MTKEVFEALDNLYKTLAESSLSDQAKSDLESYLAGFESCLGESVQLKEHVVPSWLDVCNTK
jgi:hypothetical protein|tara:strand:+ start:157 stop:342 length:186 start_codon:yes stop_codon:yes gene_type:complete